VNFFQEKKRNLRENISVSFFGHPSAKIGPKNKFLNSIFVLKNRHRWVVKDGKCK
jgi:hypothetical protein